MYHYYNINSYILYSIDKPPYLTNPRPKQSKPAQNENIKISLATTFFKALLIRLSLLPGLSVMHRASGLGVYVTSYL